MITVLPGPNAIECGRARWCQGCDRVVFAHHMLWTYAHTYRCLDCVAPGDEAPIGAVADLIASVTNNDPVLQDWGSGVVVSG